MRDGEECQQVPLWSKGTCTFRRRCPLPRGSGDSGATGAFTVAPAPYRRVYLLRQGPFFNQQLMVQKPGGTSATAFFDEGTGMRGKEFRALLLLHELGHVTGKFGPDSAVPGASAKNTQAVLRNCF